MNLTYTSKWFKKFSVFLIFFVLFYYLIIYVIVPFSKDIISKILPEKNPPTIAYGILPRLEFTSLPILGEPRYELNTKDGGLPLKLPKKLNVFEIFPKNFTFDAGLNAQQDALLMGFNDNDLTTDLKGRTYRWKNLITGVNIEIDLDTQKFLVYSNVQNKSNIYQMGFYSPNRAISQAKNILRSIRRIDSLYEEGNSTAIPGRYLNQKLILTEDSDQAYLYRVDLFRSIDNYPIFGPDAKKGLLHLYIGKDKNQGSSRSNSTLNIPIAEIYFNEINLSSQATYPLIPIQQVWNQIKNNRGIISSVTPTGYNPFAEYEPVEIEDVLINEIYLGYFENYSDQTYLQPIYIFEGNYRTSGTQGGDIVIYYPAIDGKYISPN